MKLAMILSTRIPPREGIGFYAWNLAQQLKRRGHTIHLITRGRAAPLKREDLDGITVWKVPFFPLYPLHVHFHFLFINALIKKLEEELDLLHLHSPLIQFPKTTLPSLVTIHSPMKTATAHLQDGSFLGILIKLQTPFSIRLEKDLFCKANRLIAVAGSVGQALSEYGILSESVSVLGNGVDTDVFRPLDNQTKRKVSYVLTAGRLAPGKGLDDLIECARIVHKSKPDVKFSIAGSGPMERFLRAAIRDSGMEDNIQLLGHVSDREKMVAIYQNADVYLHPSHYEGLPTVILEAMACACPVVATAVGGIPTLIQNGINGLLVPPGDVNALAGAVLRLLNDPGTLGVAAYETVRKYYSWEMIAQNYEIEYQALLKRSYAV